MMQLTANYAVVEADDEWLTDWMLDNLEVRAAQSAYMPLSQLERAVGRIVKPVLDQERSPLWTPNPWRDQVANARERKRLKLRRRLGAVD